MKNVALVAAHFVPSNLAAVHRARLWAQHLPEFGWKPLIVTAHWKYYEEPIEPELVSLLAPDLRVVRTNAFPTRPIRLVGDIGIRAFPWHYRALIDLATKKRIDFVHITIPSNYSSLLGRLVQRATGVRYGIDYIDPWVHESGERDRPFSRARISQALARWLEPWAVAKAALITGINHAYFEGMLRRNPNVRSRAVLAEMPYGGSTQDHTVARQQHRTAQLFQQHRGKFNLVYAGAMLPKARSVLERFLGALGLLRDREPDLASRFHLHFIGTGKSPTDAHGFNILPAIRKFALEDCASEYPQRIGYFDVLTHLHESSGILILGSTEPHYSPSKVFQALMSRRPVLALLHRDSTAIPLLGESHAASVIAFDGDELPMAEALLPQLRRFIYENCFSDDNVNWSLINKYSARQSAQVLASALDEATKRT